MDNGSAAAMRQWAASLSNWAKKNASALQLDDRYDISLQGFHTVFRVAPNGQLMVELVAQFAQQDKSTVTDPAFGGLPYRGGTTVIGGADGKVRYVIAKPMSDVRRATQRTYVAQLDARDASLAWCDDTYEAQRMKARTNFAALHRGLH
jgi:hypothetical protein